MNRLNIVVEGQLDAILLRKYLPEIPDLAVRLYAAGGMVSLSTVARNLLVHEEGPVLVVMDTDSLDPAQSRQAEAMASAALKLVASEDRFDVFAYSPEHEVVFFEASQILGRYWTTEVLTKDILDRGHYAPRQALVELLARSKQTLTTWITALTSEDGEVLRAGPQATQLIELFKSMATSSTMAA